MEFIKLKLNDSYYNYAEGNSGRVDILALFLASDVGCYRESFDRWLMSDSWGCEGNLTVLEKIGDSIQISDLFSEEPDKGPFITMSKHEFQEILDAWKQVCKEKPAEVTILRDESGKFSIKY